MTIFFRNPNISFEYESLRLSRVLSAFSTYALRSATRQVNCIGGVIG
jgi:hypothetical protein